jgi:hypothetical protein
MMSTIRANLLDLLRAVNELGGGGYVVSHYTLFMQIEVALKV